LLQCEIFREVLRESPFPFAFGLPIRKPVPTIFPGNFWE
jgi:hypothetical protein